jgi:hypothetical protein
MSRGEIFSFAGNRSYYTWGELDKAAAAEF